MYPLLFLSEVILLFFLSRGLIKRLSMLFHTLTRSKKATVYLLSLLFLPGTVIHELSHFMTAKLLFVHTGKINLFPEIAGNDVILGTVAIARTDLLRRFLIGAAPFVTGICLIIGSVYGTIVYSLYRSAWISAGLIYIIFEVGNTMFSSKKDMEGALIVGTLAISAGVLISTSGITIDTVRLIDPRIITAVFQKTALYMLIPVSIDALLLLLIRLFR